MKKNSSTTAILLFARSTASEMQQKWLPKGEEIYTQLNDRALKLAAESGLTFFHSTEEDQIGEDFGSRFAYALQQIFDRGFTSIISIGNDTPNLTQNDLQLALEHLEAKKSVIGPSRDGGIYLLGIHASEFEYHSFSELRWCTSNVQHDLHTYFKTRGKTLSALHLYSDLDSASDLYVLSNIRGFIPIGILKLFRIAVEQFVEWFEMPEKRLLQPLWLPHSNKGSPR